SCNLCPMRVIEVGFGDDDARRREAYLAPRARAVTDLPQWRQVLADAYRLRTHALLALDGEHAVGALDLVEVRRLPFGHYLATAAFGNDGGLFFERDDARDALVAAARA